MKTTTHSAPSGSTRERSAHIAIAATTPIALVMLLISATALGIAVWSMSRGNIVCAAGTATATSTPLAALQTMAIHSSTPRPD